MQNWAISFISIIISFLSRIHEFFVYHIFSIFSFSQIIFFFRTKATNYASISFHKNKSKNFFLHKIHLSSDGDYWLEGIDLSDKYMEKNFKFIVILKKYNFI